jgi:AraC family transcriptional regulator of adaptative response/methylated-DNA-[protein]-cysteine methyltransferase
MNSDHRRVSDAISHLASRWRDPPSLTETAAFVGLGPHHFQRLFSRMTGVSPKRFTQALAADHAERMLADERASVLAAAVATGLSSPGRLHDLTMSVRAMTPGELRRGDGLRIAWGVHETPFGACLVARTPRGVCELAFLEEGDDPGAGLAARWPRATRTHEPELTAPVARRLSRAGEGPLGLHVRGTNFQIRVWRALLAIPPGRVSSYGEIAREIGRPSAARAVGRAVGSNPVSILIPCHRVLRAHGELGGYRWGLERKRALLAWERALAGGA